MLRIRKICSRNENILLMNLFHMTCDDDHPRGAGQQLICEGTCEILFSFPEFFKRKTSWSGFIDEKC